MSVEIPGEILFFQSEDGKAKLQVRLVENSVWLSQRSMADLYQVSVKTISEHVVSDCRENGLNL